MSWHRCLPPSDLTEIWEETWDRARRLKPAALTERTSLRQSRGLQPAGQVSVCPYIFTRGRQGTDLLLFLRHQVHLAQQVLEVRVVAEEIKLGPYVNPSVVVAGLLQFLPQQLNNRVTFSD